MENSIYLKCVPLVFEDHGSYLLKALYEQQKKSQLCDVSLVVENVSFPAHKTVLAAYSAYFYALFDKGKQSDEAGSKACNVTTIHLSSITVNTFIPILHFLYTSKLHVFSENVRDIMRTARKLQIPTIVKACEQLLVENVVLPSIHGVKNKQSTDTIVTQSNSSQSVLYVDLRSEDDDEDFQITSSVSNMPKPMTNNISHVAQSGQSFAVEHPLSSKQRSARTQKKKGFPKKIQQSPSSISSLLPSVNTSPAHNISTVSPASIFGRVGANQVSRPRSATSPMLPLITSSDRLGKLPTPTSNLTIEPLTFESNLESLGSIFGSDSSLIMDPLPSDSSSSASTALDKTAPSLTPAKTSDSLQLQSVFSMSPKLATPKATISTAEWNRLRNIADSVFSSTTTLAPAAMAAGAVLASPSSTMQGPGPGAPSVYSCKECFKYFTNLPDALHHIYVEHSNTHKGKNANNSAHGLTTKNSHSCPECGRIFNNKNNLKRHILIKHTSDKRFKCSLCGRRYAIRQSLKYHMRSIHGRGIEDVKVTAAGQSLTLASPTSSFDNTQKCGSFSTTPTFSFAISPTSSCAPAVDPAQQITSTTFTSTAAFLAAIPLASEQENSTASERMNVENEEQNLPTIQRIESIGTHSNEKFTEAINKQPQDLPSNGNNAEDIKAETRTIPSTTSGEGGNGFPGTGNTSSLASISNTNAGESQFSLNHSSNVAPLAAYAVDLARMAGGTSQNVSQITPRLHRCDHCARIFSTLHAFTRHRRTCHKHECPICHRGFSQMGNMRRHMKIFHSDKKPYECHICNKAYGIKQSFRYHMRDKHGAIELTDSPKDNELANNDIL